MVNAYRIVLTALIGPGLLGQAQPFRIVPANKPDVFLDRSFAHKPTPMWENGYFLAVDKQPEHAPRVTAFDSSGTKLFETSLAMDGVVRVNGYALAASAKGTFAVSGSAYSADGSGVSFIALIDKTGHLTRIVRMERFAARKLCFTDDGRLWAAGGTIMYPSRDEAPDHDMIRIYDEQGTFQRSLLRRSTFPPGRVNPFGNGNSYLTANGRQVVFFSGETGRLVGISYGGEILFDRQAALPAPNVDVLLTGFAVSDASDILMSCQIHSSPPDKQADLARFYRWDTTANTWIHIYSRPARNVGGYHAIFGFEGI